MNWDDAKFSMLVFGIAQTTRMQTRHFPKFAVPLWEKNFTAQMKVADDNGGQSFMFRNGEVTSCNGDVGGHHLTFDVEEVATAVAHLSAHEVRVVGEATVRTSRPSAGQTRLYSLAARDTQLELFGYLNGKGRQSSITGPRLGSLGDPPDHRSQSREHRTGRSPSNMQSSDRGIDSSHRKVGDRRTFAMGSKTTACLGPNASSPFQMRDPRVGVGIYG